MRNTNENEERIHLTVRKLEEQIENLEQNPQRNANKCIFFKKKTNFGDVVSAEGIVADEESAKLAKPDASAGKYGQN